jgi:uncharacterized protein (TIGR03083 family)
VAVPVVTPATPVEAISSTVDDLERLLAGLGPEEWAAPTRTTYGRVRDLVAHLVGVEELVDLWLRQDDEAGHVNHITGTMPVVTALAAAPPPEVLRRWAGAARRNIAAAAAAPPDQPLTVHDIPTDVEGMLVLRTFEVWTHAEDIAAAVDRPRPAPDAARLRLMSTRLVGMLPIAVSVTGPVARTDLHLVLTGPGGGTYDIALDGEGDAAPLSLVADVTDFCRVAARRLEPEELGAAIDGDRDVADLVLAATGAFAQD